MSSLVDIYAYCINDTFDSDFEADRVHLNHTYKVVEFVNGCTLLPIYVRLKDVNNNDLEQYFFITRFMFFRQINN